MAALISLSRLVSKLFLNRKRHRELGQSFLGLAFKLYVGFLETVGIIRIFDDELKAVKDVDGPLIIASNHPAIWDALLLIRRFGRVSCVMKTKLLSNPLLGGGARFAGFIASSPRMETIRVAKERLEEGGRLLLFPEGTRTRKESGVINVFRPGLAMLAQQSGAQVLPVFISTNSRYLEKGCPIWKMPELPISISIRVGEAVIIEPDEGIRDFTERLEGIFKRALG